MSQHQKFLFNSITATFHNQWGPLYCVASITRNVVQLNHFVLFTTVCEDASPSTGEEIRQNPNINEDKILVNNFITHLFTQYLITVYTGNPYYRSDLWISVSK